MMCFVRRLVFCIRKMPKNPQTELETTTKVSLGTKISLGYTIATAVLVLVSVIAAAIWTLSGSANSVASNPAAAGASDIEKTQALGNNIHTLSTIPE